MSSKPYSVSRWLSVLVICFIGFGPIQAFSESENAGETVPESTGTTEATEGKDTVPSENGEMDILSYARKYLSPVKKIVVREAQSLKKWFLESVDQPTRRGTPKVVIDLPAPQAKKSEPELEPVSEPQEQDEKPVEVSFPDSSTETNQNAEQQENSQSDDDAQPEENGKEPAPDMKSDEDQPGTPAEDVEKTPEKISDVFVPDKGAQPGTVESAGVRNSKIKLFKPGNKRPPPPAKAVSITVPETQKSENVSPPPLLASAEPHIETAETKKPPASSQVVEVVDEIVEREAADAVLKMGRSIALETNFDGVKNNCIEKHQGHVLFCSQKISWPAQLEPFFKTNGKMYQGAQVIVRYDSEKLTHAHALFSKSGFRDVVSYFEARYGPPLETFNRIVVPFEGRPVDNPTFIWRRNIFSDRGTLAIILEVRAIDDSRGGFPDMQHGLVRLYGSDSLPIFPRVSPRQMMLVKFAVN